MARTGRAFPATPIILHGKVAPTAPIVRPPGPWVYTVAETPQQTRGSTSRKARVVVLVGARIAQAPPPTVRVPQIVVTAGEFTRTDRPRRQSHVVALKAAKAATAPIPTNHLLQPLVVLADHTRLPRVGWDRVQNLRGVVAPAAPPATPPKIEPTLQNARSHRPVGVKVITLRGPSVPIVRPPTPLIASLTAEAPQRSRYRCHTLNLRGVAVVPTTTPRPPQTIRLAPPAPLRRRQSRIVALHGRVFVAPGGAVPPITNATYVTPGYRHTSATGSSGATTASGASGKVRLSGSDGSTDATGQTGKTGAD